MKLNRIIRLYVPGTVASILNREVQDEWVERALDRLTDLFGGATAMEARGAYKDDRGTLIKEPIVLVYSFTDEDGLSDHRETVVEFAQLIAVEMGQECVSVEIEGELHLIYPPAKAA